MPILYLNKEPSIHIFDGATNLQNTIYRSTSTESLWEDTLSCCENL